MTPRPPVLSCSDVRISYFDQTVVDGISLEVNRGELVTIIGQNATGKSTLLRAFCNLKPIDAGDVYLNGESIYVIPERDFARQVAFLPQSLSVPMGLTVGDLVLRGRTPHYPKYAMRGSAEDHAEVNRVLDQVGLGASSDRDLNSLSGGELQRVWIAFALVRNPEVLILDEPTSHLDARYQKQLMELLVDLKKQDIAILTVLHDVSLAVAFSDRLIGLDQGAIAFDRNVKYGNLVEDISRVLEIDMESIRDSEGDFYVSPKWR